MSKKCFILTLVIFIKCIKFHIRLPIRYLTDDFLYNINYILLGI